MAPETHLFASWFIAAKTTSNDRDCRLVTLAGLLPDLDGLGILVDWLGPSFGLRHSQYYATYHHYLLHGAFGAVALGFVLMLFGRERWRVLLLAIAVFHLHLLCDFAGSRGPSREDLWPIFYFGPFERNPMWIWRGQWRLDGWQNRWFSLLVFVSGLLVAIRVGYSFVGVFSRRMDAVFVGVLRKWYAAILKRLQASGAPRDP